MKGYVTINTDASHHPKHNVAAFAFWIVSDYGRITQCGPIKEIKQKGRHASTEAETKSIINGFHVLKNSNWTGISKIIVNTDNTNAIAILTNDKFKIKKYSLQWGGQLRHAFNQLIPKKCDIEFRHVPAHKNTDTPKAFVNDWCDKQAKLMLWETINSKK